MPFSEQPGDPEDGRVTHRALARDREGWQQHQAGHVGDWLPHPLPRLQQGQQRAGEEQPGQWQRLKTKADLG